MPTVAAFVVAALAVSHVRAEAADVQRLLQEAVHRSPMVRTLIDRLDQSDVFVYVRIQRLDDPTLDGRTGWLSQAGGRRYLAIDLSCGRPALAQIAILAHELQHAVEIADAQTIVDPRSLARHYERIGIRTSGWRGNQTFETRAAIDVGSQARREVITGTNVTTTVDRY